MKNVMLKSILNTLFIFLVSIPALVNAQAFEEAFDKCFKAYHDSTASTNSYEPLKNCLTGLKFPSFESTSLDNKQFTLESVKGKVVLINLWFIACPPCVAEIPIFNELQDEFNGDEFVILSFALDNAGALKKFMEKHSVKFNVFPDANDVITNRFKMNVGYPTNILLNREGQIIDFSVGGAMSDEGLAKTKMRFKQLIEDQLAAK
jgi:peroxiredoxin